jgi:hypothetical protein
LWLSQRPGFSNQKAHEEGTKRTKRGAAAWPGIAAFIPIPPLVIGPSKSGLYSLCLVCFVKTLCAFCG